MFQNGIHDYLQRYQYRNAETKDLWEQLEQTTTTKVGKLNIAEMMNTWTSQVGYPYLEIKPVSGKNQLQITQVPPLLSWKASTLSSTHSIHRNAS